MEVTADMVKTLRQQSGAGIMDCKNALKETNGDMEEAVTYLRKKGMAKADKKGDRSTGDGAIGSYIHAGNKIGVLVNLQCETDFVANTDEFKDLLKDIAMHIAAAKPRFISREDVTQEVMDKEREIFAHQARESGKPENIIDKIVDGKMYGRGSTDMKCGVAAFVAAIGNMAEQLKDELELLDEAGNPYEAERFLAGQLTPVF